MINYSSLKSFSKEYCVYDKEIWTQEVMIAQMLTSIIVIWSNKLWNCQTVWHQIEQANSHNKIKSWVAINRMLNTCHLKENQICFINTVLCYKYFHHFTCRKVDFTFMIEKFFILFIRTWWEWVSTIRSKLGKQFIPKHYFRN